MESPPTGTEQMAQGGALEPIQVAHRRLARTINLGLGFDPASQMWGVDLREEHFDLCAAAGFSAVRLPVNVVSQTEATPPYRIRPALLDRVAWAIDQADQRGLALIVCNFVYPELMVDPPRHRDRLLAIIDQLAAHCQDAPASMLLEPLAEPHDTLDPLWNEYLADILSVVRHRQPMRPLIVGPGFYNTVRSLAALAVPEEDRNLIVTIHQYWPLEFTFQGEDWFTRGDTRSWLGTTWQGTEAQRQELAAGFALVAAWARAHDRPIFMGEFGSSTNADMASRVRWTRANRLLAEQHGFAWGYWSFGPLYALYDHVAGRWHEELLSALFEHSSDQGGDA